MRARFNQVDEFIEELKKDAKAGLVKRNIIRLTNLFTMSKLSPNIQHLQVVATYELNLDPNSIVRFETYCGDVWGLGHDEEKLDKAKVITARIEKAAEQLTLEVRGGVYEEDRKGGA